MREIFDKEKLKDLWVPDDERSKFDAGQVAIIGGSQLFHGAPILALRAASRIVDMVYFSGIEKDKEVADKIKAGLSSFIWVAREEVGEYIEKSDAVLIGPGLMRYEKEDSQKGDRIDGEGRKTRELTKKLLEGYKDKRWVIDGGSLQVMEPELIPSGAVVTPNQKEFEMLFGERVDVKDEEEMVVKASKQASRYECVVVLKGPTSVVTNGEKSYLIRGGSSGLAKGGTGDVLAGLIVGLMARNESMLAASFANWLIKRAGERLENERGEMFNADDVADMVTVVWGEVKSSF